MKKSLFALFVLALFCACSGDDSDSSVIVDPEEPVVNLNANDTLLVPEYGRLEVPHLKGGHSRVLIHRTSDYGVNYMTEWDDEKYSQRWSCYVLDRITLQQNTNRYVAGDGETQYPFDPELPDSLQFTSDPFWGSGYDHGHICPSADRLCSAEANYQTFYLTNMQPQFNAFNAGIWATMEEYVRDRVRGNNYGWCDSLFVCKGGTIDEGTYGGYNLVYHVFSNKLLVPRYFYMALLRKSGTTYNAVALWIDQTEQHTANDAYLNKYAISIDELESRTGIDFFCNLPDAVEDEVEQSYNATIWGLK